MRLPLIMVFLFLIPQAGAAQEMTLIPVPTNTTASFRGLSVVDNSVAWVSGSQGTVGKTTDGGKTWELQQVEGYEKLDFRSLYAFDAQRAIIANAGSPAYVLRTEDGGKTWATVFTSTHADAFFDGIDFWNDREGLLYGDPMDGTLLLLRTTDSGKSWAPVTTAPKLEKGEASFAASGTGIRCIGKRQVFICTGGVISRLWVSDDGGATWSDQRPPVVQGKSSTGIFSVAIQGKAMTLVGGDFQDELRREGHHLFSRDGGRQWEVPQSTIRGYRECVEWISSNALIAVGPGGIDISTDGGLSWKILSDEKGLHVIRKARRGERILIAGSSGKLFQFSR
jgi:photosystem II stability/assembly factor-like uncharacterized protein